MKALFNFLVLACTVSVTALVGVLFAFVMEYISGGTAALYAVVAIAVGVPAVYGAVRIEKRGGV